MATIYCMNCGIELEEGTRFCPECGSPTLLGAGLVEAEGNAQVACPACGALNDYGNKHCAACGKRLQGSARRPRASVPERRGPYGVPEDTTGEGRKNTLVVGGVVALAVGLVLAGSLLFSGVLGGAGYGAGQDALGGDGQAGASDASISASAGSAGVAAKAALADYSWDELSIIAKEMTRQPSRADALEIAKEYNLVDAEGHMLDATKDVELVGLGSVKVRLADVYHDNLANGEGKAGMSFIAANLAFSHNMNSSDDITGGWEGSELRQWLNTTIFESLDESLRTNIVQVDKLSDNVGHSTSPSSVSSTIDALWLPSMAEIIGPIGWTWPSDPDNSDGYNAIASSEGEQYALFAEMGVEALAANPGLELEATEGPIEWWERSCSPSGTSKFRAVSTEGDPTEIRATSNELGVCLGFCL